VTYKDMTIADVLADPLIRQMMRADGVALQLTRFILNFCG
jgi:hypothetical protein